MTVCVFMMWNRLRQDKTTGMPVMAVPFVYILSYSFSNPGMLKGGLILWPAGFTLDSYTRAFADPAVLVSVFVSIARTVLGPALMLLFTSMGAYALTHSGLDRVKFFRKYFVFYPLFL